MTYIDQNAPVQQILICSDPIMTKEKEQYSNRRWIRDILDRPIYTATGLRPKSFMSSLTQQDAFQRKEFFRLSGIELNIDDTQFFYNHNDINEASLGYLAKYLSQTDLLIAYELSEQTRIILDRIGVRYVDIWLHPVRYLDDILFAIKSNVSNIDESMRNFDVNEYTFRLYADRIKVMSYKGWRRQEAKFEQNSALFVGQMLNDKSVCRGGQMLSVCDFKPEFEAMVRDHSTVYYSRHPYLKKGDEDIIAYISSFPSVKLTDVPTYRIISNNSVRTVMSVSSSVLFEAKYFDKKVITLFKPVIPLGADKGNIRYTTIYQEMVNPHFWEKVLSGVVPTRISPNISFLDGKDKLRDMLGFYWGYKEVDKLEELRTADSRPAKAKGISMPSNSNSNAPVHAHILGDDNEFRQTAQQFELLRRQMLRSQVISFDVFDTLIERSTEKPDDLFKFMEIDAAQITAGRLKAFAEVRRKSRGWAIENGLPSGEEVNLLDRYAAIRARMGLTDAEASQLHEAELQHERRICQARFFGKQLFNEAKAAKKRVILISDTYFTKSFVEELLRQCGYDGWDELYVSSEKGMLKRSGRLFSEVLKIERCKPRKIMHVGDDEVADVDMARKAGISSYHVPSAPTIFRSGNPLHASVTQITNTLLRSAVTGLVAAKSTADFLPNTLSYTAGKVENFGYAVVGPMMFGFAKWILETASENDVKNLYFLSRDGEIAKRCYDIIAAGRANAPKSHYVMASRRAVRVAGLFNNDDIVSVLETNFTPCTLRELFKNRFGIQSSDLSRDPFIENGYQGDTDIADWRVDQKRIVSLFTDRRVAPLILQGAGEERRLLQAHYNSAGMGSAGNVGFVDIGHSGTLQANISRIMGLTGTYGYYFATHADIDSKLSEGRHNSAGYAVDRVVPGNKLHPYMKNILMFEMIFLNAEDSFLRFTSDGGEVTAEFLSGYAAEEQKAFARSVHDGACQFCEDLMQTFGRYVDFMDLPGTEATIGFERFLENASIEDVRLMSGLSFENSYSGRSRRWILPPDDRIKNDSAIWEHGRRIVLASKSSTPISSGVRAYAHRLIERAVLRGTPRQVRKFNRFPQEFFADSKSPLARVLGKIVYGSPDA